MTEVSFNIKEDSLAHYICDHSAFLAVDDDDNPVFFIITNEGNIVCLSCPVYSEFLEPRESTIEEFCKYENLRFVKAFATTDDFHLTVSPR